MSYEIDYKFLLYAKLVVVKSFQHIEMQGEIQLRSEVTGMDMVTTFEEAFQKAQANPTIWKVSFEWIPPQSNITPTSETTKKKVYGLNNYRLERQKDESWQNCPMLCMNQPPYCDCSPKPIPEPLKSELLRAGFTLRD